MSSFEMLRFVAANPIPSILRHLAQDPSSTLNDASVLYGPNDTTLEIELLRRNLVMPPDGKLSIRGRTCVYCIEGIEGANIVELVDKLRNVDPTASRLSLVREGMTRAFLAKAVLDWWSGDVPSEATLSIRRPLRDVLARLEPLRRLMICSPWINLDRQRLRKLIDTNPRRRAEVAIEKAHEVSGFHPEVTVVTRPIKDQPDGENNETLGYFQRIGAVLCYESRLHSKLYIIESGSTVTQRYAFIGSENFTKVRYQELGIFVDNDNLIIEGLMRYFLNLATTSL